MGMEYVTANVTLSTVAVLISIVAIYCSGIAITRVTKSEFLEMIVPLFTNVFALLIACAFVILCVVQLGNIRDENNALITDTVTSKFGEFTVKNENVKALYPDSDYDIELKSLPKETCRLNTADKPDNITVECGTFTPAPQH